MSSAASASTSTRAGSGGGGGGGTHTSTPCLFLLVVALVYLFALLLSSPDNDGILPVQSNPPLPTTPSPSPPIDPSAPSDVGDIASGMLPGGGGIARLARMSRASNSSQPPAIARIGRRSMVPWLQPPRTQTPSPSPSPSPSPIANAQLVLIEQRSGDGASANPSPSSSASSSVVPLLLLPLVCASIAALLLAAIFYVRRTRARTDFGTPASANTVVVAHSRAHSPPNQHTASFDPTSAPSSTASSSFSSSGPPDALSDDSPEHSFAFAQRMLGSITSSHDANDATTPLLSDSTHRYSSARSTPGSGLLSASSSFFTSASSYHSLDVTGTRVPHAPVSSLFSSLSPSSSTVASSSTSPFALTAPSALGTPSSSYSSSTVAAASSRLVSSPHTATPKLQLPPSKSPLSTSPLTRISPAFQLHGPPVPHAHTNVLPPSYHRDGSSIGIVDLAGTAPRQHARAELHAWRRTIDPDPFDDDRRASSVQSASGAPSIIDEREYASSVSSSSRRLFAQ